MSLSPEAQQLIPKWLAALRSGTYQQGEGRLNSHGKYCCLGVLCEVQGFAFHTKELESDSFYCHDNIKWYNEETSPTNNRSSSLIQELDSSSSLIQELDSLLNFNDLATRNDNGATFLTIADRIEFVIAQPNS